MRRRTWRAAAAGTVTSLASVLALASPAPGQTVPTVPTVPTVQAPVTVPNVQTTVNQTVHTAGAAISQVSGPVKQAVPTGSSGTRVTSPVSGLGNTVGGVFSHATGGAAFAGVSSGRAATGIAGSSHRAASPGPGYRSAFDRLPRRVETLVERIELGRHARANLRRLEHALASASPRLRARLQRALRAEIRRLRHGGITAADRARIRRLKLVQNALRSTRSGAPMVAAASPRLSSSSAAAPHADRSAVARPMPTRTGGTLGAQASGSQHHVVVPHLPQTPNGSTPFPFMLLGLVALGAIALGFAGVAVSLGDKRNQSA